MSNIMAVLLQTLAARLGIVTGYDLAQGCDAVEIGCGGFISKKHIGKVFDALEEGNEEVVERLVLQKADVVIGATPSTYESLKETAKRAGSGARLVCLTNGFDPDDYGDRDLRDGNRINFAYVGSLGGEIYSPYYFFAGLNDLLIDQPDLRDEIRVTIAGAKEEDFHPLLDQFSISGCLTFLGFVSHREAVQNIMRADVLLLLLLPENGVANKFILSSKTFEYIGSGRPIMAMVTEGDTADFLRKHHIGEIVNPTDVKAISGILYRHWKRFKEKGRTPCYTPPHQFSRKETAERLLLLFRDLISDPIR